MLVSLDLKLVDIVGLESKILMGFLDGCISNGFNGLHETRRD
ncbi:hypothetical protein HMPREF9104_00667 [Lentilactobacillus kisonensis F0435]|uniref:Uncharacterized protein n=1 Tax=Lentilactobacillus kisonensis F0435 TaxID=797516 RepID=H1LDJ2_9LACO|nr:hypothetical protein HMPREF9104_00667 [Lentilactobacillus kisonensis F0435]